MIDRGHGWGERERERERNQSGAGREGSRVAIAFDTRATEAARRFGAVVETQRVKARDEMSHPAN
jgi:hypothetical protein